MFNLPSLPFLKQYPIKHGNPLPFIIKDEESRSRQPLTVEDLAASLADEIQAELVAGLLVGKADEVPYVPSQQGALRVIRTDRVWHRAKTDLLLRQQSDGLYVEWDIAAESPLLYLQAAVHGAIYIMLWFIGMWLYFRILDTDGLILQFAQKYGGGETRAFVEMYKHGMCFEQATGAFVYCASGGSWFDLFRWDPPLFISYMIWPMGIIGGLIFMARKRLPTSLMCRPCQYLDWPTPQEFEAFATHQALWMQSLLSRVLLDQYGIGEQHIHRLNK